MTSKIASIDGYANGFNTIMNKLPEDSRFMGIPGCICKECGNAVGVFYIPRGVSYHILNGDGDILVKKRS